LIFGAIGLAMRWVTRNQPAVRYAADSSYWVYLVHHPLAVFLPVLLASWHAPAEVKCALVIVVVTAISVASYHLLVRSTPLGLLLNGRRYPFVLPWRR
jgi:peptidoglycan/LPS O-acetylase OafA/YrhL